MTDETGFLAQLMTPEMRNMAGMGLLNLSQNKSPFVGNAAAVGVGAKSQTIGDQTSQILKLFGLGQDDSKPQQITGTNPSYQLPTNNPISNTGDSLSRLVNAIGTFESGNNYASLGPVTKGDRAYGRYQVMGSNIPAWTKEVLGRSMTPQEFLQDQQAQDAVAHAKLGSYLSKYGNINDASSMWFSGRPSQGNNSKDVIGTSVPDYMAAIRKYY